MCECGQWIRVGGEGHFNAPDMYPQIVTLFHTGTPFYGGYIRTFWNETVYIVQSLLVIKEI